MNTIPDSWSSPDLRRILPTIIVGFASIVAGGLVAAIAGPS
jgi:hypothetical protein